MHGDPQANLLEILDPEQNLNFVDNYLDFKVDLSNVLFICSANITDSISEPLLDRMDVIELSSYTDMEKKEIYNKHLYPKILKEVKKPFFKTILYINLFYYYYFSLGQKIRKICLRFLMIQ